MTLIFWLEFLETRVRRLPSPEFAAAPDILTPGEDATDEDPLPCARDIGDEPESSITIIACRLLAPAPITMGASTLLVVVAAVEIASERKLELEGP